MPSMTHPAKQRTSYSPHRPGPTTPANHAASFIPPRLQRVQNCTPLAEGAKLHHATAFVSCTFSTAQLVQKPKTATNTTGYLPPPPRHEWAPSDPPPGELSYSCHHSLLHAPHWQRSSPGQESPGFCVSTAPSKPNPNPSNYILSYNPIKSPSTNIASIRIPPRPTRPNPTHSFPFMPLASHRRIPHPLNPRYPHHRLPSSAPARLCPSHSLPNPPGAPTAPRPHNT